MTRLEKLGSWLRKMTGVGVLLLLLATFLLLYFFKYVPTKQQALNERAFRELEQIGNGFRNKNEAYTRAIPIFLKTKNADNPLLHTFHYSSALNFETLRVDSLHAEPMGFEQNEPGGDWQISYHLSDKKGQMVTRIYTDLAPLLNPIINTYKDIFQDYLVLRDRREDSTLKSSVLSDSVRRGEIVFNSGFVSLDYLVNLDSLLKNYDGFNLINVHDVLIEGASYKVFMYPLQMGKERVILAGLVSVSAYRQGYKNIPFGMATLIGVLVLLLFIHLPILKIYVLGTFERIRGLDIRLIIGSYFVAAFVTFFLFSRIFLNHVESMQNYTHLKDLSQQVQTSFFTEIDSICGQLRQWDSSRAIRVQYWDVLRRSGIPLHHQDSIALGDSLGILDALFHPHTYPYLDDVYWIDSSGKWAATWTTKKAFSKTYLIPVADRPYFQDFLRYNILTIPGKVVEDSFTIQPTLSKRDGDYNVNVIIPSKSEPAWKGHPKLIGLSTQMYSVCNPLLPCGYSFTIIDDQGSILYDSKPGRALLSNIEKETENSSDIIECLRYRNERFFGEYTLRGQSKALLVSPMRSFPYALLVSYDLAGADGFQAHLIGLSGFFGACALILLILSALIKEWFEKRPGILQTPYHSFEWLQPTPVKRHYYVHLIKGMGLLLFPFIFAWIYIETFRPWSEFSLFFISLLFPIYLALHYYLLREKQVKDPKGLLPRECFVLPNRPLLIFLSIVIIAINVYASYGTRSPFLPLLLVQILFGLSILWSVFRFQDRRNRVDEEKPAQQLKVASRYRILIANFSRRPVQKWRYNYILAIVLGIFLTSILPAISIFWLLFRQETLLQNSMSRLAMARSIDERRITVNERIDKYKLHFNAGDDSAQHTLDKKDLHRLKFKNGIYLLSNDTLIAHEPWYELPTVSVSPEYTQLHRWFFPHDSSALAWTSNPSSASDNSWRFLHGRRGKWAGPELLYYNQSDAIENRAILLETDSTYAPSSFSLMMGETLTASPFYKIFYFGGIGLILLLIWVLTTSLTKRIYLLDIIRENFRRQKDTRLLDALLRQTGEEGIPEAIDKLYRQEKRLKRQPVRYENRILENSAKLDRFYATVWSPLTEMEQFVLYDFATDGFTNYKNADILNQLVDKNILRIDDQDECLEFMTYSFREWILRNNSENSFATINKNARDQGPWETLSKPLLVLLAIPGLMIFFTQDDLAQRVTGFLTALAPLLPLLSSFLPKKDTVKEPK